MATQPFDMVVIGASGDLAHRKLLPSLYYLHKDSHLAEEGRILGVARKKSSREEYLSEMEASCREHVEDEDFDTEAWRSFAERLDYVPMSATEPDAYGELRALLQEAPERIRVFYLATSPRIYGKVCQALHEVGLVTPETRIVLEKPIGSDLASARAINKSVGRVFQEDQIYRIDHYLGKETVQNLMAIRFGNLFFEPMWRSQYVDHVQITVAETLGMEGRGSYYDHTGALRDMVQNHLLQLLCLVAMEPPTRLGQDSIREEKIKVLKALKPMTTAEVKRRTVRGQYRKGAIGGQPVDGYLDEENISPDSETETYVALWAEIENWRWAGVPFYLRTGKRMGHRVSEIVIQFRRVPHVLFPDTLPTYDDNRLVIRLQPDESIKLAMMIKRPGSKMELKKVDLDLDMVQGYAGRMPLAYERLLLDVIRGSATLFMHRDEVEEAWRWIETTLQAWKERGDRPRTYSAGAWGPTEAVAMIVKDDRIWYEHVVESERRSR